MVASSAQLRSWWSAYRCNESRLGLVGIMGEGDKTWPLRVAKPMIPAFELFALAQEQTNYPFRETAGGTYKCRLTASGQPSLHGYGIALDINPKANPQRRPLTHDYPPEFIKLVLGIKTKNGKQVFAWGGLWTSVAPDAMHWQSNCSPADLATGLVYPSTPRPPTQEDPNMTPSSWAAASWKLAKEAGILTEDSVPRNSITVEQFMVFLSRIGVIEPDPSTGKGRVDPDLKGPLDNIF